jgi:hypothetical protein
LRIEFMMLDTAHLSRLGRVLQIVRRYRPRACELTASYALDALDAQEAAEYEAHLAHCEACRKELAALQAAAASLADALEGPAPAPELRDRILVQARRERSNVVPLAARRRLRIATAAAAVAACAALGLGIWPPRSPRSSGTSGTPGWPPRPSPSSPIPRRATYRSRERTARSSSRPRGAAALVLRNLEPLSEGQYYTAWVSPDGESMTHAGAFRPGDNAPVFPLTEPVPDGGLVAVTIESKPDADEPSSDPIFTSSPYLS